MSERPFMQLYVSDFVGDTLYLSTEQVGAYLLLLMAMWNAGGSLPDDEGKLARVARMSVKKWRAVAPDLMAFFDVSGGAVRHNRLTKELQKSEGKSKSRASAGERGGRAKALKNKERDLANATDLLWHSPDTRNHIEAASQLGASAKLYDRLIDAASSRGPCHPNLAMGIGPITDLIAKNYDIDTDILPVIRERADPSRRSWSYFVTIIVSRRAERQAIPAKPAPKEIDWGARIRSFRDGVWPHSWGPKPGEPGCMAPADLLRSAA